MQKKKVLVVGKGGREHALVKALGGDGASLYVLDGSGIPLFEKAVHVVKGVTDKEKPEVVAEAAKALGIDLVVIGPELPLTEGLADQLRSRGVLCVGPGAREARLEGSKVFAKEFMQEFKVATSFFRTVASEAEVRGVMSEFTPPYVLKADGLCGGKGVFICKNEEELMSAANQLFVQRIFKDQGSRAVMEQFMPGYELSVIVITNGQDYEILPLSQDHKQLYEGDKGPNTGGMGTFAPFAIEPALLTEIKSTIIEPTLRGIYERAWDYRGFIFFGIMVTGDGPKLLEYNCRLGDPETQSILPLIENSLLRVFLELAEGRVERIRLRGGVFTTCVVVAAPGYPFAPRLGGEVVFRADGVLSDGAYFICAGVGGAADGRLVVDGGRVLGAVGIGRSAEESRMRAYGLVDCVEFKGQDKVFRRDIGQRTI